jgi:hypothetical protein
MAVAAAAAEAEAAAVALRVLSFARPVSDGRGRAETHTRLRSAAVRALGLGRYLTDMDEQNVGGETEFPQGIQLDGTHRFKVARTHTHAHRHTNAQTHAHTHTRTHTHARTRTHARNWGARGAAATPPLRCHSTVSTPWYCEYRTAVTA